jgi:hypothetical protein
VFNKNLRDTFGRGSVARTRLRRGSVAPERLRNTGLGCKVTLILVRVVDSALIFSESLLKVKLCQKYSLFVLFIVLFNSPWILTTGSKLNMKLVLQFIYIFVVYLFFFFSLLNDAC